MPLDVEKMQLAGQACWARTISRRFARRMSVTHALALHDASERHPSRQLCCGGFKANAFVHHMVRNIVGSLVEIGAGISR